MGCNTSKDTVLQPVDGAISNGELGSKKINYKLRKIFR